MVQKVCLVLLQAKKKISNLFNHLFSYMDLLQLKCRLPMSVFSGYHAANKYDKNKGLG